MKRKVFAPKYEGMIPSSPCCLFASAKQKMLLTLSGLLVSDAWLRVAVHQRSVQTLDENTKHRAQIHRIQHPGTERVHWSESQDAQKRVRLTVQFEIIPRSWSPNCRCIHRPQSDETLFNSRIQEPVWIPYEIRGRNWTGNCGELENGYWCRSVRNHFAQASSTSWAFTMSSIRALGSLRFSILGMTSSSFHSFRRIIT